MSWIDRVKCAMGNKRCETQGLDRRGKVVFILFALRSEKNTDSSVSPQVENWLVSVGVAACDSRAVQRLMQFRVGGRLFSAAPLYRCSQHSSHAGHQQMIARQLRTDRPLIPTHLLQHTTQTEAWPESKYVWKKKKRVFKWFLLPGSCVCVCTWNERLHLSITFGLKDLNKNKHNHSICFDTRQTVAAV